MSCASRVGRTIAFFDSGIPLLLMTGGGSSFAANVTRLSRVWSKAEMYSRCSNLLSGIH